MLTMKKRKERFTMRNAKLFFDKTLGAVVFVFCLFLATTVNATPPVISAVSANPLAQGVTATITGTYLEDRNLTGLKIPPPKGGFEGTSFTADGWYDANYNNANELDLSVRITGNKSYRNHIYKFQREDLGGGQYGCPSYYYGGYLERTYGENWPVFYFRYYVRYNKGFVWPDNYMKQLYMRSGWCMNVMMGATGYGIFQPGAAYFGFPKALEGDRWYCLEGRFHRDGSAGELWLDDKSVGKGGPGAGGSWDGFMLGTVNSGCFSANPQASSYIWFDDFNFSTTGRIRPEALVYLSTSPDFNSGTKVSQELLYISDNSIQFKPNATGLGTGPLFLFVVNNKGEVSAGYSVRATTAITVQDKFVSPVYADGLNIVARSGEVRFSMPASYRQPFTIAVKDMLGRTVWRGASKGSQSIWVQNKEVKEGVYFASIQLGAQKLNEKFMVIK